MKTRTAPKSNYRSIWLDSGKTLRFAINPLEPITELEYPEFYDISLTAKCDGKCPGCYRDSKASDEHYSDVVNKLRRFFNSIPKDSLPYQIAYGGGEPTSHPDFSEVLKVTKEEFGITPNYTTNGMWVYEPKSEEIIEATKKYAGGVAVSCHPHLNLYWSRAAHEFLENDIRLNFHNIISDAESIDRFIGIFDRWRDRVEYFVLLPYGNVGRAKDDPKEIDWDYLVKNFPKEHKDQIAFGANFYPYLLRGELDVKVSLYEPEILSKFITLEGNGFMYPSSFSDVILKENIF